MGAATGNGNGNGRGRGTLSEINVTPLVDVMLVLLVIFMVTAPMMNRGVDVKLPPAEVTEQPREQTFMVTVDENGDLYIDKKLIHAELLATKVAEIRRQTGYNFVYVRADETVPYGRVMYVMDQCKKGGIEEVGLVVQPSNSSQSGG